MKRLLILLLVAGCHQEVKKDLSIQTQTKVDIKSDATVAKDVETHVAKEPDVEEVDDTLDVAATPTAPAQHFTHHVKKVTGKVVEDKKEEVKVATHAEAEKVAVVVVKEKTETKTDVGPGLRFYLFLLLALGGAAFALFKFKLWRFFL